MKVGAIVLDTVRELLYRRTLLFYFGIVTLTHLLLLLALQTDVANGALGSVRVFGMEGHGSGNGFSFGGEGGGGMAGLTAAQLASGIQIVIAFVLYPMAILLAVFATSSIVPHMLEKGAIDLLLSKPVSRPVLLLSRYLGALLVAGANLIYLVGGVGVILALKTGVFNAGFVLSGLLMTLYFGALLAFLVLWGVVLRSTTIGIMMTAAILFTSLVVRWPHASSDWPMLITGRPARYATQGIVEVLYHALPRTMEFTEIVSNLILRRPVESWSALFGTVASGAGALACAVLWFRRTDF
jgi:hypothetical protein